MISRKPRDSLTKVPGRTGKFGSRPLDLDLVAQIRWDLDLIVRVQIKSDGSDRKGSTAAARVAGKLLPAAALCDSFTGLHRNRCSEGQFDWDPGLG